MLRIAIRSAALLALAAFVPASYGTITIYTSQAAFNAATTAQGVDTFTGFSISGTTPSPISRNAGAYSYQAACSTSSFFGAGTVANPWLSTNVAADTVTFSAFSASISAIGGNFFGSNSAGSFAAGDVALTVTDGDGTVSQSIIGATVTSFLGFVSTNTITSMTLASVAVPGSVLWPTADNLVLAQAIPAPSCGLALLGVAGMVARRRRSN
ncbi:hypothetical protein BH11PLA1_BH11PLA1_23130 [soil metagenome]